MLKICELVKIYHPKRGPAVVALDKINLSFGEKGMVFLLGKSGSGKSTLLNLIGGLDSYTAGDIEILGKSTKDFAQSNFDSYRNTFIGFIFQEFNILPEMSVGKNIALALELQHKKNDRKVVDAILEQVDLKGYYERNPNELSGGQKQRVAIARALVKNPQIIMADEPTGQLDTTTGKQVFDTLKKLSKEKLVIVVTHDRDNAEVYGDRIVELADGKVIVDKTRSATSGELEDTPVEFIDNKLIRISAGTTLTEEDVKKLNALLASSKQDAYISLDEKSNVEFVKKSAANSGEKLGNDFEKTTERNNPIKDYDKKNFRLVKSRLPWKDSFKMGASGLKYKKIRLGFTILLSFFAILMFGFSSTASSLSIMKTEFETLISQDAGGVMLQSTVLRDFTFGQYYDRYGAKEITDEQINGVKNITGMPVLQFADTMNREYYSGISVSLASHFQNYFYYSVPAYYQCQHMDSFLIVPEKSTQKERENEMGITPIGNSRLPESGNEIAISDYIASLFMEFGYKNGNGTQKTIGKPEDLIGESLSAFYDFYDEIRYLGVSAELKIVGVYKTDIDIAKLERYKDMKNDGILSFVSPFVPQYAMIGMGLVSNGFTDYIKEMTIEQLKTHENGLDIENKGEIIFPQSRSIKVYARLPKSNAKIRELQKHLETSAIQGRDEFFNDATFQIIPYTTNSAFLQDLLSILVGPLRIIFFWLSIAFSVFAGLMLLNFIGVSISYKKKEIGVLRAIGARSADVFKIFLCEGFIIGAINLVLASIGLTILCVWLNSVLTMSVFVPGFLDIFYMVLLCFGTIAVATFLPVNKIARKKPIDAINNR